MTQHYIKKCHKCEAVISQCRCPAPDKIIKWGVCASCYNQKSVEQPVEISDCQGNKMKKFNATRTIIQVATIEAESLQEAGDMAQGDSEAVAWRDTSNRFMVFDNLEEKDD